uniref:Uncharacterized protein n=1 Tax=Anguilla anguilla TaxID=7936 RepID=A0A0E9PZ84_ANGAN
MLLFNVMKFRECSPSFTH